MIVAVGSDKGAPGATTLATALAAVWPTDRVLLELDPRGADLPYRMTHVSGQPLRTAPSVVALAVDSRPGSLPPELDRYAQHTALGVPLIPGELTSKATARLVPHLPSVASAAARWRGTALVDLGSLQPSNPALVVARAAEVVLLTVRATLEGLGHLRDRVEELSEFVGDPRRVRGTVGVVVVAEPREERAAVDRTGQLLASIGSPVPVVGSFSFDAAGAAAMWTFPPARKLDKSPLIRSAIGLQRRIQELWLDPLTAAAAATSAAAPAASTSTSNPGADPTAPPAGWAPAAWTPPTPAGEGHR